MKATLFLILSILPFCLLQAQFVEDFSDGDFTNAPTWSGNTDRFIIDNGVLRLNDTGGNTSYLSAEAATSTDATTTWEFWVQLEFSPS